MVRHKPVGAAALVGQCQLQVDEAVRSQHRAIKRSRWQSSCPAKEMKICVVPKAICGSVQIISPIAYSLKIKSITLEFYVEIWGYLYELKC